MCIRNSKSLIYYNNFVIAGFSKSVEPKWLIYLILLLFIFKIVN